MTRKDAFNRIRQVVGPETCPDGYRLKQGGAHESTVERMTATTHQMRHCLATLLILHKRPDTKQCPNCQGRLPYHHVKCMPGALMASGDACAWTSKATSPEMQTWLDRECKGCGYLNCNCNCNHSPD